MAAFVDVQDDYLSTCAHPLRGGYANVMEEDLKERAANLGPLIWKKRGFRTKERIRFSSVDGWDEDGGQAWVSGGGERLADVSILPIGVLGVHRQKRLTLLPPSIILSQSPREHCSHDRARIPLHLNDGSVSCTVLAIRASIGLSNQGFCQVIYKQNASSIHQ